MNSNISDNQNLIIRKGEINDLPEMQQLFTGAIDEICKKDYDPQQLDAWKSGAENEERWMNVISNQFVLIVVSGGHMAGFCTLDQGNYIDLLFVHKEYQHKGIASLLYSLIEQEALQHHEKEITADVSKTARPFFEKTGFQVVKEQTVYVKGIAMTNYKMIKHLLA
ncbi:GNAT family N-acetyltransferase [Chryseobacterium viscerum]|uniref:GNAT family N-acetyltransferase n=1 Tax=Chryseobacterium viscerum TaxID=1037377 RepID=A0A5N4BPX3_9FLAO|nr:GNAT family N-acetyltransferase [Chryseobacterium viscerum]KAB1230458.1 GNAT family N-acetyltransferase [Chryseobacterium viscerum]